MAEDPNTDAPARAAQVPALAREGERTRRLCDRAAALLLALFLGLLLHSAWRVGPTFDEHFYVASGYAYWQDFEFGLNREHPPLVKLLVAAPLLALDDVAWPEHWRDLVSYPATFFYQLNAGHLDRNLLAARLLPCLLATLLALVVYRIGRRTLGPRAGLVALLLFAFNPNVLAHMPLAALDGGVTVFLFLSLASFVALLDAPSWRRALLAAVLFGLANLAKFTALVLAPFTALLALVVCVERRSPRPLGWTALVWLGGLTVFAAGYGFETRSVNEAWTEEVYVTTAPPSNEPAPSQQDLARAAVTAGLPEGAARRLATARDLTQAITRAGELLGAAGEAEATALVSALGTLEHASPDERKHAFSTVLHRADAVDEATRCAALAALADVCLPDLASARRWYRANEYVRWEQTIFTQRWIERLVRGLFGDARQVPLFTAWKGIDYQLEHGSDGHTTWYRGHILQSGRDFADGNPFPEYYAVVMAVKNPLPWLLLVLAGLLASWRRPPGWSRARSLAFVGFPLLLFLVFSRGNALLGVKYLLPIFPFLALVGATTALRFPRAALWLAGLSAALGVWLHPHELMYFNLAAGGPEGGPRITIVGDDWGQGLRALGRFRARWKDELAAAGGLHYAPYTAGDPAAFGLADCPPVQGEVEGIVAVNLVTYYRDGAERGGRTERTYAWLDDYEPFARVDRSILLFDTRGGPPGRDPLPEWRARDAAGE